MHDPVGRRTPAPAAGASRTARASLLALSFVLVVVVALGDGWTGEEIHFSIFYLLPVGLGAWFVGRGAGILVAIACAMAWYGADVASGHTYSHPAIVFWNTAMYGVSFLVVSVLLSELRRVIEHERATARTDPLTGIPNARYFDELAEMEVRRAQRYGHPFTIGFLDLDDFKQVNDRFGHSTGDEVLRRVAETMHRHLRSTDVVARLGGDEFAILLTETDERTAGEVLEKLRIVLQAEMGARHWPVTFSIGAATFHSPPARLADVLQRADELMYRVKNRGKGGVCLEVAS